MITNLWNKIDVFCGCHDECSPVRLIPHEGPHSMFYSCPKYYPENRNENEIACANRLNLIELEEAIERISREMEDGGTFSVVNLRGFKWKNKKSTEFKVIRHDNTGISLSIRNIRSLR